MNVSTLLDVIIVALGYSTIFVLGESTNKNIGCLLLIISGIVLGESAFKLFYSNTILSTTVYV